ncbi:hypothetical protein EsH8_VII_000886 [Colletotrichum jinshuiense]
MMNLHDRAVSPSRPACSECQRRKQKCDRQWPCNHCQKRKVASQCRFRQEKTEEKPLAPLRGRKRSLSEGSDHHVPGAVTSEYGFETMGYMRSHPIFGLEDVVKHETKPGSQGVDTNSLIESAIRVLPPRPYTDALVQRFLDNVNYHYYIIYPPKFLEEYKQWWGSRTSSQPLDLEWTCLLITVCACTIQYLDPVLKRTFQNDLGESMQSLTERYHDAAQRLSSAVPGGRGGFTQVQQLIHSCYWYKSEGRYVDCWHALNAAVKEAQELGMHRETVSRAMSDFDQEMRRRIWCILDTWDWQISNLLSRPLIIDRSDCQVDLPSLSLEGNMPSPIMHIKLQGQLIRTLSQSFEKTGNSMLPSDVQRYEQEIEKWIESFPPQFSIITPDTTQDETYPWLVLHRQYLYTIGYIMKISPAKSYLVRRSPSAESELEQQIKATGIDNCLLFMEKLEQYFAYVYPHDARFHFVLFSIFDTGALLCSALLHDTNHLLPRRNDITNAITSALSMLQKLQNATKSASASYSILSRLVKRLSSPDASDQDLTKKRAKTTDQTPANSLSPVQTSSIGTEASLSWGSTPPSRHLDSLSVFGGDEIGSTQELSFGNIFETDISDLSVPWDWESLDLDFSETLQ